MQINNSNVTGHKNKTSNSIITFAQKLIRSLNAYEEIRLQGIARKTCVRDWKFRPQTQHHSY